MRHEGGQGHVEGFGKGAGGCGAGGETLYHGAAGRVAECGEERVEIGIMLSHVAKYSRLARLVKEKLSLKAK